MYHFFQDFPGIWLIETAVDLNVTVLIVDAFNSFWYYGDEWDHCAG